MNINKLALVPLACAAIQTDYALAQNTGATVLEELVVTARKRTESLVEVPISIAMVSGDAVDRFALRAVDDISKLVANLYVDKVPAGPRISVRGLGNAQTGGTIDSSVGLVIDGQFYGRPRWLSAAVFDVERIEVLRGPQSTYFGKNTTAGLVNITSRNPGDELQGYLQGANEFDIGGHSLAGAIGGPLSETVGLRLAVRYFEQDGFLNLNNSDGEDPDIDETIARLTMTWAPTETLDFNYKFTYLDADTDGNQQEIGTCGPDFIDLITAFGGLEDCRIDAVKSRDGSIPGGILAAKSLTTNEGQSHVLTINSSVGDYLLSSVTSYQDLDSNWWADGDWTTELTTFNVNRPESYEQYSQEFRLQSPDLGPVSYIVGLYADKGDKEMNQNVDASYFGSVDSSARKRLLVESESWAVYGELSWSVSERIRLLLGGRYTEEEQEARLTQNGGALGVLDLPGIIWGDFDVSEQRDTDDFSPSLTVQWDVTDDGQLYVSYKEGFKSGGYDLDLSGPSDRLPDGRIQGWEYGDEDAENYEIGVKLRALDNRLLLTGALFQTEFADMQVQSYPGDAPAAVILNAAEATVRGIELEASWAPTNALSLNANFGYLDSEYDSFPTAPCYVGQTPAQGCLGNPGVQNLTGERLPLSPDFEGSISIQWQGEISASYKLQLGAQATYRDEVQLLLEQDPLSQADSLTLVDARIALVPKDGRGLSAALVGNNIFDEEYVNGAIGLGFADSYTYNIGTPRRVELQIRYDL